MKRIFLFFTVAVCIMGCNGYEHQTIPYTYVNFTIYPNDVSYSALNHFGGYMYFTGGVDGIVIYRLDYSTFVAYDRACPYDWENPDSWIWVEDNGLILHDSCCGSRFNILDGTVINGPSRHPLKYYRTSFDGMRLHIYN